MISDDCAENSIPQKFKTFICDNCAAPFYCHAAVEKGLFVHGHIFGLETCNVFNPDFKILAAPGNLWFKKR
jgi:hypothetical protein